MTDTRARIAAYAFIDGVVLALMFYFVPDCKAHPLFTVLWYFGVQIVVQILASLVGK